MDRDSDDQPINGSARRASAMVPEAGATRGSPERKTEYFSVRLTFSGTSQDFEDPRLAGEAFFRADPAERPSVTHIDGNTARTMAHTEVHGAHETGETRYFKSLPDSHAPDAEFRSGFLAAMEASISERLERVTPGQRGETVVERLDSGLKDDLEAFARREPERAAGLWTERTEEPAPGPILQAAVKARKEVVEAAAQADQANTAERPTVIAAGDWVTTDRDVDLRPVAVATERGVHAGFEARPPEGKTEISFSERAFETSREALRHGWDFYEGGETGVERAAARMAGLDHAPPEAVDAAPMGLVIEHREQPEFPRPETAIYAGEDAHLVMTLGRDNELTRDFAEKLVADPGFRTLVSDHIPDAATTLGPGRFVDGEGSAGFLADERLAVSSYGRDGGARVLATFPDESPLSEALARHLTTSPVVAAHLAEAPERVAMMQDPVTAISAWVETSAGQIDRLPPDRQDGLHAEMQDIAKEASIAFGVDRERDLPDAPPRSTLYGTALAATSLRFGPETVELTPETSATLKAGLLATAIEVGIDEAKIARRLETGAANAREEEGWVRSDIADVSARQGLDLGNITSRGRAAELVDRFYERAADLIHATRTADVAREQAPLAEVLGGMAKVHAVQGSVAFRTEEQARDFTEEMKERYGGSVLRDMAAGRTEAIARDIPNAAARQAVAAAVVSAAKEHPAIGLTAQEVETAERNLGADAQKQERPRDHARNRTRDRDF